jgi:putative sigma-54 modulation protein
MRLRVNGRNINVTPALKEYVEEKIGRITKYYDQIMDIEVTLGVIKNPSVQDNHFAEVTCTLNGARIHVHEEAQSMYASIDLLADKLDRQVKRHKDKIIKGKSGSNSIRTNTESEQVEEEEELLTDEEITEVELKED